MMRGRQPVPRRDEIIEKLVARLLSRTFGYSVRPGTFRHSPEMAELLKARIFSERFDRLRLIGGKPPEALLRELLGNHPTPEQLLDLLPIAAVCGYADVERQIVDHIAEGGDSLIIALLDRI